MHIAVTRISLTHVSVYCYEYAEIPQKNQPSSINLDFSKLETQNAES